jgi:hypothetical protein
VLSANREGDDVGITCQMCGTENGDKQKFCSACGKPLETQKPADAASSKQQSKVKAKTMIFGGAAASIGTDTGKNAPLTKEKPPAQKTMLGMVAPTGSNEKPLEKQIPVAKVTTPTPGKPTASKPAGGGARTMLGMTAPTPQASTGTQGQKADKRRAAPAHKSTGSRTMLGMPALGVEMPQKVAPASPKRTGDEEPQKKKSQKKAPLRDDPKRSERIQEEVEERSEPAPGTDQMPEVSDSGENAALDMKTAPITSPFMDDDEDDDEFQDDAEEWPEESSAPSKNNMLLIAVITAGIVALLVIFALVYLLFIDAAPVVNPQIFPSPDGKSLVVALPFPAAPPGTSIQAAGQTVQVAQGTAQVTLPLAQLKLGLNDVVLTYLEPGESPEQITFPIVLRHTIKDDFSGLASEKPFITVTFQIAPDVRLAVEGKSVQVVNNSYFHKIQLGQIPEQSADFLMHKVPFQLIDAAGAVEQGEHVVAIPITKLQIDRPAADAQVVADFVTCAGSAEPGAQVTVNDSPVGVTAAGFSTTVPLETLGERLITVVSRAPGKAPRSATVKVVRIESLAPAIEEWSADLDKKLDYPTIGRDPNTHIGKKVKLNGRVVNINTEKGVTAFILYVGQGCPAKSKCAVYVVFKGETDAGLQSWVDVYGTVRGTRTVEMQNGVKIDVPAVDAVYVVKSDAKTGKKKKK